ncbi:MAG: ribonuclease HII [Coriobacteriia bacterium]|nr:ribonuclease HII [Coriobacteriia bacterium]
MKILRDPLIPSSSDDLFSIERHYHRLGHAFIVGIDEVGYGSLAGPVTVAACILDESNPIEDIKDSKKFSSHEKRALVAQAIRDRALAYSIAHRSNRVIDELGIVTALQQAQLECIEKLSLAPDRILIDGTPYKETLGKNEDYLIKGDATVACIAAASILAKVARDELMMYLASDFEEYDRYDIAQNKGYGTLKHRDALREIGLSTLHRKSYCAHFID